ncbi:hypothetical protein [Pseudaestuariivita atlantica]|uniref:hypothetical protein n=1 Tax=Pseudaestuariivita atlantica TaxID=1317121 RepID=UPI00106D5AD2|nr:hypothetical protein [Pseudaestuariivita atlantica]
MILALVVTAAARINDRFSCGKAAWGSTLSQQFSRCVRAQRNLKTSGMGSESDFAALPMNGGFELHV